MAEKTDKKDEGKVYTIDVAGKVLGRVATQIATILRGKHLPSFRTYKDSGITVVVKNVDKIKVTGKKMEQKKYYSYSGYIGGLKERVMKDIFEKDPKQILIKAVYGMLPKNKLRRQQIKRLKFE